MKFEINYYKKRKFDDGSILYFAAVVEEKSDSKFFVSLNYFNKYPDENELEIVIREIYGITPEGEEISERNILKTLSDKELEELIDNIASRLNIKVKNINSLEKIFKFICENLGEFFSEVEEKVRKKEERREKLLKGFSEIRKEMYGENKSYIKFKKLFEQIFDKKLNKPKLKGKELITGQEDEYERLIEIWKEIRTLPLSKFEKLIEFVSTAVSEGFSKTEIENFLAEYLDISEETLKKIWENI